MSFEMLQYQCYKFTGTLKTGLYRAFLVLRFMDDRYGVGSACDDKHVLGNHC